MAEALELNAYWGPREWSEQECAQRWWRFLEALKGVDSVRFADWQAGDSVKLTPEALPALVHEGRHYNDNAEFPELGFQVLCWIDAADPRDEVQFKAHPGSYSQTASPNNALLRLGRSGRSPAFESIMDGLFDALVTVWEPDWAFAGEFSLQREQIARYGLTTPAAGRLTYLSAGRARALDLPPEYQSRPAGDGVVVPADPADVMALRELIEKAGAGAEVPKDRAVF